MESDERNILISDANDSFSKLRKFKLEPALLFMFFGYNIASMIVPNQLLQQSCLSFGFNSSDCYELITGGTNATRKIEEEIQPRVAEIIMTTNLVTAIIPAIMSLFIGPWTDKFGRKKVISAACVGFSLTIASFTLLSMACDRFVMVDPWLFVLPYIPMIVTGGWPSLLIAVLCYVTDTTDEVERSSRLSLIELIIFTGVLFGIASCSYILAVTSATTVFVIGTACVSLSTLYIIAFVDESVQVVEDATAWKQIKELVSPAPVADMLKTCFKKRPFRERRIVWCLIFILMFSIFTMNGAGNIFYLFVREKFHWTLKDATQFDSISLLISIVGGFIGIGVLKKILNFSDLSLAIVAITSTIIDSLMRALAQTPSVMYLASFLCLFKILAAPMCRSLISNIIPSNEIGKVYSVTSSFEAISSLVASPLYTFIYAKTFTWFAGAFYIITAVVYGICLVLAFCVMRMRKTRESLLNPYSAIQ